MKFLIVTSVLNGAQFLNETLDSVSKQTWSNWRHLIIDAGSIDGTLDIIQHHIDREPRAELLRLDGTKLYEALLAGFDTRRDDETMLAWLNADDLYAPWALETIAREHRNNSKNDWYTGLPALWDETGSLRCIVPIGSHSRQLIAAGWYHEDALGCLQQETIFFTSRLYESLTGEDRELFKSMVLAGDFVLWKAFAKYTRLHSIPTLLGGFRVQGENRSIAQRELYTQEVRAAGGQFPPRWLAKRLRSISDLLACYDALRASRQAQHRLHMDQNRSH